MDARKPYAWRVLSSIGWALVILWGLMQAFGVVVVLLAAILEVLPIPAVVCDVIYELAYGAGYLATFMLPVLFLRWILRRNACHEVPMEFSPRVSPYLGFLVAASVAICFAAAQLNALLLEVIHYSEFTSEVLLGEGTKVAPYMAVLRFIVVAVVPAFCEEFLFRGAILGNLLPFGRARAVLISAIFFALMHQNAGQLLYTFVAGVALGLIYAHTRSIWNCIVVHLINNLISVLRELVYAKLGATVEGNAALLLMEGTIYLLGVISVCVLIARTLLHRKMHGEGVFGKTLPSADGCAVEQLCTESERKGNVPASVILYAVLCGVQILLLMVLAMLGGVFL